MTATGAAPSSPWRARVASTAASPATHRAIRAIGLAVPVLLVNTVAFFGQFGYLKDHLPWPIAGVVLAALALESIAIYLQWHAHLAQLANDTALRLRLASYLLALGIAALNYSHYAGPHWRPTAAAVICALMSAISPWLWSVHSRRVSRDELMARGLIEEHAVRLGATRWSWHPFRSAKVMSGATWTGETNPARAIAAHGKPKWGGTVPPRQDGPRATVPAAHRASVPGPERPAIAAVPASPSEPGAAAVPAVHSAAAHLAALPELPHRPSEERISEVELELAGMEMPQLQALSYREVARMLGDPNQRRLGRKLLDSARLAKTQSPTSAPGHVNNVRPSPNIAWPVSHRPGGVASGG